MLYLLIAQLPIIHVIHERFSIPNMLDPELGPKTPKLRKLPQLLHTLHRDLAYIS